jgi:hypothetical protein
LGERKRRQPGGGVFAATGNAVPDGQPHESINFAEDIVKLSLDLSSLLSDGNPAFVGSDMDFGATPLLFTANGCAPSLAALAKSGEVFVYWDRNNLVNPQRFEITIADLIGIPAWDSATQLLFVTNPADASSGAYKRGLIAFGIQDCQLAKVWQTADVGEPANDRKPHLSFAAHGGERDCLLWGRRRLPWRIKSSSCLRHQRADRPSSLADN